MAMSIFGKSLMSAMVAPPTTAVGNVLTGPLTTNKVQISFPANGTKRVFSGHIEVLQAANGYIVNIGRSEGYGHEVHVAMTVTEVNEIIAAQIVAFRLENKS
jgi:hypothetical protein